MAHSNPQREIKWQGWSLTVGHDSILVLKDGEHRIYDLNNITKVEHDSEYVFLYTYGTNGGFYQVKFEEGNFLVIDEFDKDGEHLKEIGSHVFGEYNFG